jgi:hypothetical protein
MNLEKGYRPAGDLIIEDADYQPAGIPSLCIEVCPTFYHDWTIPEMVMPVHDMSRSVPQQLVRILRGERQIRIDAGVHVDPMPVDVHQRERLDPAEVLLRHDLHVDDVTIILSVGDQGGPAAIIHPPSSLDWLTGPRARKAGRAVRPSRWFGLRQCQDQTDNIMKLGIVLPYSGADM